MTKILVTAILLVTMVWSIGCGTSGVATVERMWVSNWVWGYNYALCIDLKPTDSAVASKEYVVELYEKDHLRATTTVSWSQPQLNVSDTKTVYFSITREEFSAYSMRDVSHIFSVKIHE